MKHRISIFLALSLLACRSQNPEAQVKRAFQSCVDAVETAEPEAVLETLSPDFSGPDGMRREEARLYLLGILRREKIGITVLSNRIAVKGNRSEQSVELMLTGRNGSGLLPQESTRKAFWLQWERNGSRWMLRELREIS